MKAIPALLLSALLPVTANAALAKTITLDKDNNKSTAHLPTWGMICTVLFVFLNIL